MIFINYEIHFSCYGGGVHQTTVQLVWALASCSRHIPVRNQYSRHQLSPDIMHRSNLQENPWWGTAFLFSGFGRWKNSPLWQADKTRLSAGSGLFLI
jgi:hypothetical protein